MNKLSKCFEKCAKYENRENSAILRCKMLVRAKKRARMRVLHDLLSNAPNALKNMHKNIWDDLEHFKFLRAPKRADERVRAHLRKFIDPKLNGRILILIMIIENEK